MTKKTINLGDFKKPENKGILTKASEKKVQKKKTIGRPPKKTTKKLIIKGYFTEEERQKFENAAQQEGRDMSNFLRHILQKHKYI